MSRKIQFVFLLAALCSLAGGTLAVPSGAGGVDDPLGNFQMDGNATTDGSVCFALNAPTKNGGPATTQPVKGACPGGYTLVSFGATTDDWANLVTSLGGGHALAKTVLVKDAFNVKEDTFLGTGSKDVDDISAWTWNASHSVQDKADIEHVFGAAYQNAAGHVVIYAGMTRFGNSGDTFAGFWFLQDSTVSLCKGKGDPQPSCTGAGAFSGVHKEGDLLIDSDFSIGGAVSTINVYTWHNGGLVLDLTKTPAPCDPTGLSGLNTLCGIANQQTGSDGSTLVLTPSPWTFADKAGNTNFAPGEFLEVGVDLNAIFGNNIPCFTTFFTHTGSSASTGKNESLSDLTAPAPFPLCGISVEKTCTGQQISSDGTSITYSWNVTVTNIGIGTLYDVTVIDTFPDGTTQNIPVIGPNTTPNSLAAKASAPKTVTFVATATNVSNPLVVTNAASAQANTAEGGGVLIKSKETPTATCKAQVAGALTVTKQCDQTNGGPILVQQGTYVVVKVPFTGTVCNSLPTGTGEEVIGITLSDNPAANFLSQLTGTSSSNNGQTVTALKPGECASYTGNYFPSAVSSGNGLVAGRYFFDDTVTASGTGAIDKATISNFGSASCPICPAGFCPTN